MFGADSSFFQTWQSNSCGKAKPERRLARFTPFALPMGDAVLGLHRRLPVKTDALPARLWKVQISTCRQSAAAGADDASTWRALSECPTRHQSRNNTGNYWNYQMFFLYTYPVLKQRTCSSCPLLSFLKLIIFLQVFSVLLHRVRQRISTCDARDDQQ